MIFPFLFLPLPFPLVLVASLPDTLQYIPLLHCTRHYYSLPLLLFPRPSTHTRLRLINSFAFSGGRLPLPVGCSFRIRCSGNPFRLLPRRLRKKKSLVFPRILFSAWLFPSFLSAPGVVHSGLAVFLLSQPPIDIVELASPQSFPLVSTIAPLLVAFARPFASYTCLPCPFDTFARIESLQCALVV
ncbi:hypothetical protein BO78DRAFT_196266 [Aspergillus sclerotiicarbonarius CBS 121057]|uniref:Secreted protein n=1 Tax=Aspergillus sclerotiicarbonarius (strain CBS 121057 / IBT 28362) TaxID=1448318 RepID=A0A319DZV7_ASPSB|nr:hypothetical protein BO78DRAFT_196266 [Aspergillus sclerotiicarbonarius CBS 121057]